MKPVLSVILPAMRGHRSVQAAIDAWQAQTFRERLEIVVLCPDVEEANRDLGPECLVVRVESLDVHKARAAGVEAATADVVFMAEDHCLPEPDCAARLFARLAEGWDVVGASLQPGTATAFAEASFVLGYGQWMMPVTSGPVAHLPGHNYVMRRSHLLEQGDQLSDVLLINAFLLPRLRAEGLRFFLEADAMMTHYDPPRFGQSLIILGLGGLGFGAVRTERWPRPARGLYALAFPAVAAAHWLRACRQQVRSGGLSLTTVRRLLAAIPLAMAWGVGEAVGAVLGRRRVERHAWRAEVKPVSPEWVAKHRRRTGQPLPPAP
jgi:hypothetical protein